ncbi:MAG: ribose-5-phosphate isomerase RpiA [Zhengella sp.]|uniref:ribose-5-phosphate isomerase RpiA n=1 Tax=Zhengella sp. TaxID=2282762 RepID=UPI001DBC5081|nr:ribose-5-phosphate isomerase RpiA [Notoacmeibacter sp.]MCC0027326.1 ribose-5-phosphate isomerase RpiA [Brucellaceae bacterium]
MDAKALKIEAARVALGHVRDGMKLGIGTGSTAEEFVRLLAEKVSAGMEIIGVPTSERTAALCRELGVPLTTLEETPHLDLTIDGADEIDPELNLVKGGGGALLREKIVAAASDSMIVIADESKLVDPLGAFPLPIEVNRFGLGATRLAVETVARKLGLEGPLSLRMAGDGEFVTDGGHLILDASFGRIPDPRALSAALHAVPGVVEHGLFTDMARLAVVARAGGVEEIAPRMNQRS